MDTAASVAGFVRTRGRKTQVLRDPTHAESTKAFPGSWFRREILAILSDQSHNIFGCDAFSPAEAPLSQSAPTIGRGYLLACPAVNLRRDHPSHRARQSRDP